MPLVKNWTGKLYGTNNGSIYLTIEQHPDDLVTGRLHVNDESFGVSVYEVRGTFDGSKVQFSGHPVNLPEGVEAGPVEATGVLSPKGGIDGTWRTSLDTAGTFWLIPHREAAPDDTSPDQLFTARKDWGPVEINRSDILEVAEFVQRDFNNPVVITVSGETEVSCYLERFKALPISENRARVVKIRGADPERDDIYRVVQLEFGPQMNFVFAQSSDEAWARGKAEILFQKLKNKQRSYATYVKKFGFGTNQFIFLATLVILPALESWWQRIALVVLVGTITQALIAFDQHIMRFASIWLSEKPNLPFGRSMLSWGVNILGMVVAH